LAARKLRSANVPWRAVEGNRNFQHHRFSADADYDTHIDRYGHIDTGAERHDHSYSTGYCRSVSHLDRNGSAQPNGAADRDQCPY